MTHILVLLLNIYVLLVLRYKWNIFVSAKAMDNWQLYDIYSTSVKVYLVLVISASLLVCITSGHALLELYNV